MLGFNKKEHDNLVEGIHVHKIFVFKDEKSSTYGYPITSPNRGQFVRDFVQPQLEAGQAIWAKHPQDFAIFEIGEYNLEAGSVRMSDNKNCIGLVQDFKVSSGVQ